MGCGASAESAGGEQPGQPERVHDAPAVAPSAEGIVDGREYPGANLPFVRFDKTAVPKTIEHNVEVYFTFTYHTGTQLTNEAGVAEANEEHPHGLDPGFCFVVERVAGWGPVIDGDDVVLRNADGLYLECPSDQAPLCVSDRNPEAASQTFKLFKQGRPTGVKHRDICFLQSWLSNYVSLEEDGTVRARRWRRGEPQTMTILNKKVVDSSTTELARRMQFQAFDLDGNQSISRAEMKYMLTQVHGECGDEYLDEVMGAADPAQTGNIPFDAFAAWADSGGLPEEQLQHAEVLGNVAQRCNDALHDDHSLVEVLTVAHGHSVQGLCEKHIEYFGTPLTDGVHNKTSKEDGWIFSNYWKTALMGLLEPEPELWARALNDAMRGLGTDEDTLTALVCTMPDRLREPIFQVYRDKYGKELIDHIESETSFSYKKVLIYQAMSPEKCRAKILNNAMVGLGTSEDQLIRVISQCDLGERRLVKECYQATYDRDLIDHVRSETSGDFQKALLCMLQAEESEFDLDADCEAMKAAMEGWGTDEAALITLVCAKTAKQMEDVKNRFVELYQRDLLAFVESETSGNFKATLQGCIRHPMQQLAHGVRDCMAGWGTDDTGLITLLVHLPDYKKTALIKEYSKLFSRDLIRDIKADTSGAYEKALCSLVRPAPAVWAEALKGAMKGLGTADELLINFLIIAKDEMAETRKAFSLATGEYLVDWIEGECSGDYKNTLMRLVQRNSDDEINLVPLYWAQRCKDSVGDVNTLTDILVSMPAVALQRGTENFQTVYGRDLRADISKKLSDEDGRWFKFFTDYRKNLMLSLMDMPVERYVKGLYDAMNGFGTDEFTLTGLVCTLPPNLFGDIHTLYEKTHGRTLVDHIVSETSFSYKKVLQYQASSLPECRAMALNAAMAGLGTSETQLTRIIVLSTMKERRHIKDAYQRLYDRDLMEHIESETSGSFKNILIAVLESEGADPEPPWEDDCNALKEAMDGCGTDEDAIIRILAGKTPGQIEILREKFEEIHGENLYDRLNDETWDWGASIFVGADFRTALLSLLRPPIEALAYCVKACIKGFGTDDTGLITCLVHLPERKRRDLVDKFAEIDGGGDLYEWIEGDTSGDYKAALLACVKPPPRVWAEALHGAMAGLGTSDNLLINWMCLSKDRMDEVREAFEELYGQPLAEWLDGDCSGDYKDTLIKLANRACYKFAGAESGLTIQAPPSREEAVLRFNRTFNRLCKQKHANPDDILVPPEDSQQEMGCVFMWFAAGSSCAPDLDKPGLWELTNACGFPPADDEGDLQATFEEWDYSGTDQITWNDFVREMATRINDPNHFEADPLPEEL